MMQRLLALAGAVFFLASAVCAANLGETTVELSGEKISSQETNLGNFIADAIRDACGADVALIHATMFREGTVIPKGQIDEQTLRNMLTTPSSQLVVLTMKPSLLQKILERSVSKAPEMNTAFLQVSGLTLTYNSAKPAFSRIETLKVNGKTVTDDNATLTVAMPRELGIGGAGYLRIIPQDIISAVATTDYTLMDAIKREFTQHGGKISASIEGRVTDSTR